jgi:hypothetical protein
VAPLVITSYIKRLPSNGMLHSVYVQNKTRRKNWAFSYVRLVHLLVASVRFLISNTGIGFISTTPCTPMDRWLEVQPGSIQVVLHSWILNSKISEATLGQQNHAFRRKGWGVTETSSANTFLRTFATQESLFLLDEDMGHQQLTELKTLPTAWTIHKNTRHYKIRNTDAIFWLTYLGWMCAACLHHANYVPNPQKEFRNLHDAIEIHTA